MPAAVELRVARQRRHPLELEAHRLFPDHAFLDLDELDDHGIVALLPVGLHGDVVERLESAPRVTDHQRDAVGVLQLETEEFSALVLEDLRDRVADSPSHVDGHLEGYGSARPASAEQAGYAFACRKDVVRDPADRLSLPLDDDPVDRVPDPLGDAFYHGGYLVAFDVADATAAGEPPGDGAVVVPGAEKARVEGSAALPAPGAHEG